MNIKVSSRKFQIEMAKLEKKTSSNPIQLVAEDGGDIETPGIEMRPIGGFDDSGDRLRAQSTGETGLGGDVVSKHEKFAARAAEGELTRKQARVDQLEGSSSNLK